MLIIVPALGSFIEDLLDRQKRASEIGCEVSVPIILLLRSAVHLW